LAFVAGITVLLKEGSTHPEAEFLDVIEYYRAFLLAIHSHLYNGFYSPIP
jgi:hypothetical protein